MAQQKNPDSRQKLDFLLSHQIYTYIAEVMLFLAILMILSAVYSRRDKYPLFIDKKTFFRTFP